MLKLLRICQFIKRTPNRLVSRLIILQGVDHCFILPANEKVGGKLELELKPLAHRFKQVMELHVVPPSEELARRYGASTRDRLLLLRPDGYVAFRGLATDAQRLELHLTERFVL